MTTTEAIEAPDDRVQSDVPIIETDTHVYMILPVDAWPLAHRFITERVGPDTPVPIDPEKTSYLVAVNRATGEIDGFLSINGVVIVQHFACTPGAGVSYSKFHELVRAALPPGTVYYSGGADDARGIAACERAGLVPFGRLWQGLAGVGVEGEDAVRRTSDGGDNRSGR